MSTGGECWRRYCSSPGIPDELWQISPYEADALSPARLAAPPLFVNHSCGDSRRQSAGVFVGAAAPNCKSHTDLHDYCICLIRSLPPGSVIKCCRGDNRHFKSMFKMFFVAFQQEKKKVIFTVTLLIWEQLVVTCNGKNTLWIILSSLWKVVFFSREGLSCRRRSLSSVREHALFISTLCTVQIW